MANQPTSEEVRAGVALAVKKLGAAAVGRALDIQRSTLMSWLGGAGRAGTDALIRERAPRLATLDKH